MERSKWKDAQSLNVLQTAVTKLHIQLANALQLILVVVSLGLLQNKINHVLVALLSSSASTTAV